MLRQSLITLLLLCGIGNAGAPRTFEVAVEELCMLASIDQPYYILIGRRIADQNAFSPRKANPQGRHWGYRFEALYHCPNRCDHLKFRWTGFNRFSNTDFQNVRTGTVLGAPQNTENGGLGSSKIRDQHQLYCGELLFGRPFYSRSFLTIGLEAGVQYLKVDFNEHLTYTFSPEMNFIHYHSISEGAGPEVGCNFQYNISPSGRFSIVGQASGALLAQRRKSLQEITQTGAPPDAQGINLLTRNTPYWIVIPSVDIRLGATYKDSFKAGCRRSFDLSLEIGYEFIEVFKGADRTFSLDAFSLGQSVITYMDFALHGPYFRLAIGF